MVWEVSACTDTEAYPISVSLPVALSKRNQPALENEKKKRTPASLTSTLLTGVDCGEGAPDSDARLGAALLVVEGPGDSDRVGAAPGATQDRTRSVKRRMGRMGRCYLRSDPLRRGARQVDRLWWCRRCRAI